MFCLLGKKFNSLQAMLRDGKKRSPQKVKNKFPFFGCYQRGRLPLHRPHLHFFFKQIIIINDTSFCCFPATFRSIIGLGNRVGRCRNGYWEIRANKQRQRSKQNPKCTISDHSDEKLGSGFFNHSLCLLAASHYFPEAAQYFPEWVSVKFNFICQWTKLLTNLFVLN